MLEVSEEALEKLAELLAAQDNGEAAVRIAIMGGGADSPCLGIIVDDIRESDVLIQKGDTPLIIDRNLIEYCRTISIDFKTGSSGRCGGSSGSGFIITPEQPINL